MERDAYKIHIVGSGVSGLIAAKTLEEKGYSPTIIEALDRVGGRTKTDVINGYQLDHGFQVLLDAYPQAIKHLNYKALELQKFSPGAVIFSKGISHKIGDPLRDLQFLLPTVFNPFGTLTDKFKVLKLNLQLKKKSIAAIFESEELTTLEYLKRKGFSEKIITNFFKPFYAGIFLESKLETSSRMFEFVYKMFGEGNAVLPKSGIEAIPRQLQQQLERTNIIFNTKVESVQDDHIVLTDGSKINTHLTIIATDASELIPNLKDNSDWKSCENLYFEVPKRTIQNPIIGLVADDTSLINNIFYHTSIATNSNPDKELLSVTVVNNHNLSELQLIKQIKRELEIHCFIEDAQFLKCYSIPKALPDLTNLRNDCSATETQLKPTIFLAGDQMLNGSLNAAMLSGERAAEGVILALENGLRIEELTSEYI